MAFPEAFTTPQFIGSIASLLSQVHQDGTEMELEERNRRIWNDLLPFLESNPEIVKLLSPRTREYLQKTYKSLSDTSP